MEFDLEIEQFFHSLEDGTFFESVSPEIWKIAENIVKSNPEIASGI